MAMLAGMAAPLGFAPYGWFFVPWLAMTVWLLLSLRLPPRRAAWHGWLFGFGMFSIGIYWVHVSIYLYGNAGLPLALSVMLLLAAYLAVYPALAAWLLATLRRKSAPVNLLLIAPAAWIAAEWLRGWLFTGFPWLDLGYSQIDSPLATVAPVLGAYGVGLATMLIAGLLSLVLSAGCIARAFAGITVLALLAATWFGAGHEWTRPAGAPLTATLVQGNIAQDLKWQPDQQAATLDTYRSLSEQHPDSALLVWPETAIPAFYDEVDENFIEPLRKKLAAQGTSLITGIPVLDRAEWKYFNAVISLADPGRFYFKVHLVPFGEYLPLRDWLSNLLSFLPVPQADFSSGAPDQPLLTAAGYPFSASICYEIAFGEQLRRAARAAAFMVNVSNDAWFGDSAAPHQHLEMARMRALETGRYLLRATNTGISAIIGPTGRIIARSGQFRAETLTATIEPRGGDTPYMRWGDYPVVIFSALVLSLPVLVRRRLGRAGKKR